MRGHRTLNTYVVLAMAADEALMHAEADDDGCMYDCLLCIVASVFSLEAFLNHLGGQLLPTWLSEYEAKSLKDKLTIVARQAGVPLDHDSAEYQRVMRAVNFRDFWAHGKTITVQRVFDRRKHARPIHALETEWERMCTTTDSRAVKAAVEWFIAELWRAAGRKGDPFGTMGTASASSSINPHRR